jgi:hypothetical protein
MLRSCTAGLAVFDLIHPPYFTKRYQYQELEHSTFQPPFYCLDTGPKRQPDTLNKRYREIRGSHKATTPGSGRPTMPHLNPTGSGNAPCNIPLVCDYFPDPIYDPILAAAWSKHQLIISMRFARTTMTTPAPTGRRPGFRSFGQAHSQPERPTLGRAGR